jgi:hypothetical protein
MTLLLRAGALLLLLPTQLGAQSLALRVRSAGDGAVRFSFAARPGVCGGDRHGIVIREADDDSEWESGCGPEPVRVSLRIAGGRVVAAGTWVGGRWREPAPAVTDLGVVPAAEAAALLLDLAPEAERDGEHLVSAAALADSAVIWPRLLRLARDTHLAEDSRRQAIFWLGQAAGAEATRGLDAIARDGRGDLEVRKQAVFALSQRPPDEGVPALIRIARTNREPEILRTALFWLGQSDDPRALALFEELLR